MPLTVKTLGEALQVGENVARKILPRLPGAQLVDGIGNAKRWEAPDESVAHITEEMVEQARREVAQPTTTPARAADADPRVRDLTRELAEEEARAKIAEARRRRLEAEAQLERVERTHEDRRDRADTLALKDLLPLLTREPKPDPAAEALRQEIIELRRRLEQAGTPRTAEVIAEVTKALTPLLIPFVNRLAAPATPTAPPMGPQDLVALAKNLRDLLGPASGVGDVKAAFKEGLELGVYRAEVAAEPGSDPAEQEWWRPLIGAVSSAGGRLLENLASHPQAAQLAVNLLNRFAAQTGDAGPMPPAAAPQPGMIPPTPASAPTPPTPTATSPTDRTGPTPDAAIPSPAPAAQPDPVVEEFLSTIRTIGAASGDGGREEACRSLDASLSIIATANPFIKALVEAMPDLQPGALQAQLAMLNPAFADPALRPGIARFLEFVKAETAAAEAEGESK